MQPIAPGLPREIAPVQLLPHPPEETVATQADQAYPMVGAAHVDRLTRGQRGAGLAIEGDQQIIGPAGDRLDDDPIGSGNHQGADGQGVGRDRGDDDGFDAGDDNGASRAQTVGRGAGRGSDDDPVSAVGADVLALNEDVDPDHPGDTALVHGHIVDRHLGRAGFSLGVANGRPQCLAALDLELAGDQGFQRSIE